MKRTIYPRNYDDYALVNPLTEMAAKRGLHRGELAIALDVSEPTVAAYVRALDDPKFVMPRPPLMKRIYMWSGGQIRPGSFYPVQTWENARAVMESVR